MEKAVVWTKQNAGILETLREQGRHIARREYIVAKMEDFRAHQKLLDDYGIDDPRAYMTSCYPAIKKKIVKSWDRLFDSSPAAETSVRMGTIWEIKSQ